MDKIEHIKTRLADWMMDEYGYDTPYYADDLTEDENGNIPVAYTELGENEEYPAQVYVNIRELAIRYELTDKNGNTYFLTEAEDKFEDLEDLYDFIDCMKFDDLISTFFDFIEEED